MAEDRRSRRTTRLLKEALVALVLERGFDAVTVEDVTERADLSRATFYKYFKDRHALLDQIVVDLQEELAVRTHHHELAASKGFTGRPVRELLRHALEERDAYRVILRGEGNGRALRAFIDRRTAIASKVFIARAENLGATMRIEPELLARAWVGEQVAVLQWWLELDPPAPSPDELAASLLQLSLRGRYWASGLDEGQMPGTALSLATTVEVDRDAAPVQVGRVRE